MRTKTTGDGKRQILSIHIPGEIPHLQSLHLVVMDHDLVTLTPATLGFIEHHTLRELLRRRPSLADLFWRDTLIDAAMFRVMDRQRRPEAGAISTGACRGRIARKAKVDQTHRRQYVRDAADSGADRRGARHYRGPR